MVSHPENVAIWNRLGLVETNGIVSLPREWFERALDLAREQGVFSNATLSTPDALKGDAKP